MTDVEQPEPLVSRNGGLYFDSEFPRVHRPGRPYSPPMKPYSLPPDPDDPEFFDRGVPVYLVMAGIVLTVMFMIVLALGLALLILTFGTELARLLLGATW